MYRMMISKIPYFVRRLFSGCFEFGVPCEDKAIYLTFDDGPVPEVTPKVLELLDRYNAKATFFCVGDNIRKYPDCFKEVISHGHAVGNHTMHHLQGMTTACKKYMNDVEQCNTLCRSELFRPPYGRPTVKQIKELRKQGYRIILWTVISYDYNRKLSPEKCLRNVSNLHSGDIVLFHDSIKAEKNMLYCLENVLKIYSEKGFEFRALN